MNSLWERSNGDQAGVTLVELLVVMLLMGVVGTAIMNVIVSTTRTQSQVVNLREVMDDGRFSIDQIQKELRQARLVYAETTCGTDPSATCTNSSELHFWVDSDQDNQQDVSEQIFYCVQQIGAIAGDVSNCVEPDGSQKYALVRWTEANSTATVLAATLVNSTPPFSFDVSPRETSVVAVSLDFDTLNARGPESFNMQTTVRLRNVATS